MRLTVSEIAKMVNGKVYGDDSVVIEGAAGLEEATEKEISFLGNSKYKSKIKDSKAGAFLVPSHIEANSRPSIVIENPPYAWAKVLEVLEKERLKHPTGIHPTAVVSDSSKIGKNVTLGPYTVIEENVSIGDNTVIYAHCYVGANSKIGQDCVIYPQVTLRERVSVGDRCVFQSGVVIGADGFGFTLHQGKHYKIPQVGGVEIGDDVEIQANTTVDRAAAGMTKIGSGTKIDNLVQIAHNVETGENCLFAALTGIAGSVKIGRYVTMGAQVGVAGHLRVGDQVMVGGRGGITHDIKPKQVVWGVPAQPIKEELKMQSTMRKLPEILKELKSLKKKFRI